MPAILLLVLIGGWPYAVVAAIALAVAGAEFAHFRHAGWLSWPPLLTGALTGGVALVSYYGGGAALAAIGVGVAIAIAADVATRGSRIGFGRAWLTWGVLYVGGLGATIVLLRDVQNGRDWVYLALLTTFAADTAAYVIGRAIGRHRMAPRISPRKTWEGFAGGWILGLAAAVVLNYLIGLRISPGDVAMLAVLLPPAAAAGDLLESAIKRSVDVKDASDLIPGHGGVLDRLDSVLFTFALTYAFARLVVL